jgi:hypothetical protein
MAEDRPRERRGAHLTQDDNGYWVVVGDEEYFDIEPGAVITTVERIIVASDPGEPDEQPDKPEGVR